MRRAKSAAAGSGAVQTTDGHELVSQSDLVYSAPATVPVAGHPIGNGRMGTMVWTTPGAIHFQINRVDVFAVNKHHIALPQHGATDYCGTCAKVSLEVGGAPFVDGDRFEQRLSLYGAEETIRGEDVRVRCFVSAASDVLALEVGDDRPEPQPLRLVVSKWRPDQLVNGEHVANLDLHARGEAAVLAQTFREGDYSCQSAVAARISAPDVVADRADDRSLVLTAPARRGRTLVLISSTASRGAGIDLTEQAVAALDAAAAQPYQDLREPHVAWWAEFWARSFVHISTPDPVAQRAERARNLLLYVMGSSSRGALPPKWNGSIFSVNGDARTWGAEYWVWTTEMPYFPLHAAGCSDLADPFFDMYVAQLPDCRQAARQRWASEGAHFGETMPFDGPAVLPEDVAEEFRGVFIGGKPAADLSPRARRLGQYDGSLTILCTGGELAAGRYTYVSHVCSSGAELAVHAWWRYRYTGDREWLATHADPLLRDTAEFYRGLVTRGTDGLYHIQGTNVHEDFWGVTDSIMDLAAIRGVVPLAIRAAELLDVDADLRAAWQGLLANLAPYPMGADPQAKALRDGVLADDVWAAGHLGEVNDGHRNSEDVWLNPVFPFEDWTLETRSAATDAIVQRVLDLAHRHRAVVSGEGLNTAIRSPIAAARAGRGADLPAILASYWAAFSPLPNGLSLFEGPNDPSVEHLGLLSMTLQEALLQSVSPHPGEPEVISVFPAWPAAWSASFRLLARGGFLVTAARGAGGVELVGIESRLGEVCRLRNPWGQACVVTEEGSGSATTVSGDILVFPTAKGGRYQVLPETAPPPAPRHVPPPGPALPDHFSFTLANGKAVEGRLGVGR
jgi:hypothetical protein